MFGSFGMISTRKVFCASKLKVNLAIPPRVHEQLSNSMSTTPIIPLCFLGLAKYKLVCITEVHSYMVHQTFFLPIAASLKQATLTDSILVLLQSAEYVVWAILISYTQER